MNKISLKNILKKTFKKKNKKKVKKPVQKKRVIRSIKSLPKKNKKTY